MEAYIEEELESESEQDAGAAAVSSAPRSRKNRSPHGAAAAARVCGWGRRGPSEYVGVNRQGNSFISRIKVDGEDEHLGSFKSEVEAAKAYDARALQLGRLP